MRAPQSAKTMFIDGKWYLIETPDDGKFVGCLAVSEGSSWAMEVVAQNEGANVVLYNEDGSIAEIVQTEKPQSWWDEISANILAYNGQVAYFEIDFTGMQLGPSPTVMTF